MAALAWNRPISFNSLAAISEPLPVDSVYCQIEKLFELLASMTSSASFPGAPGVVELLVITNSASNAAATLVALVRFASETPSAPCRNKASVELRFAATVPAPLLPEANVSVALLLSS